MDRFTLAQGRDAVTQALQNGTAPMGLPAAQPLEHGTMKLYFYRPRGEDKQPPHDQDELYVVVNGSGTFVVGDSEQSLDRVAFGPGDAIFTPAGAVHRFEDFSDDLETWVIMYGPEGGEKPGSSTTLSQED